MDIHLSLQIGPLEAEITADSEEDYEKELVQLMDFIQRREEQLSTLSQLSVQSAVPTEDSGQSGSERLDDNQKVDTESEEEETEDAASTGYTGPLSSLLRKVDVSLRDVSEVIDIDPGLEEPPLILTNTEQLGETVKDQQLTGSLLLLCAWKECYDESPVMVSDLKDALEHSGVSTNNLYQMYDYSVANQSLRQSGNGRGTKVRLTRVGEREAFERIEQISE
ncbi:MULTISPECIES: hypothetical protein [unclassified Haloferax]|uniref:hypothetical protein n=1 Tax=unclassified Haloferax TaxID=2625095 RepID=UPI000E2210E0|nr:MULTISPECIES: hypothetical protein [unclassified Haloferax]RDZ33921.1 hypothetical protein C5B88_14680 [Haloferax sp. Atlit-24N]RLM33526.1 hypothetical protein DVK03_17745 [Haloferax sp. Atlit-109R]RLM40896.1 hypothetical protein DVK04_18575 [Haloferax sp. Atlit-105R]